MSEKEWICKTCLKTENEVVQLQMFQINFKEAIYMCMNKECRFPFYEGHGISDYIVEHKLNITDSEESDEDDDQSSHLANRSTENSHNKPITDSSSIIANGISNTTFAENDILNSLQDNCTKNLLNTNSDFGSENLNLAIDCERDLGHILSYFESASTSSDVISPESGITKEYDQDNMLTCVMGNGTNSYQQKETTSVSEFQPKDYTAIENIQNFSSENVNVFDEVNNCDQEAAVMEPGQSNFTKSWLSGDSSTILKTSGAEECTEKERVLLEESTSMLKGAGIKNSTGKNNPPSAKFPPEQESRIDLKEDDQIFTRKESALPEENPGKRKETSVKRKYTEQERLVLEESHVEQKGACGNEIPSSDKSRTLQDQKLFLPKRSTRARKKMSDYHYY